MPYAIGHPRGIPSSFGPGSAGLPVVVGGLPPGRRLWNRRARDMFQRLLMESIAHAFATGMPVTLWITVDGDHPAEPSPAPIRTDSRHCLLFAVDIVGFTGDHRDNEVQLALRKALYEIMIDSFDVSGIPWENCVSEDRGDGMLVAIPAQIPTIAIIDPLLREIGRRLRRHNRMSSDIAKIRLRLAGHIGEVHQDSYGFAGVAVNELFRMLDAPALRDAVRSTDSEVALIVSDYLYESVVSTRSGAIDPAAFRPVVVHVKQFQAQAWLLAHAA